MEIDVLGGLVSNKTDLFIDLVEADLGARVGLVI